MKYTSVRASGNQYNSLKALVTLGVPYGESLPIPDNEDGMCLFILTDNNLLNGVLYYWNGLNWKSIDELSRFSDAIDQDSNNEYIVQFQPQVTQYEVGNVFKIRPTTSNSGPTKITVDGLPQRNLVLPGGALLSGGEIIAGYIYLVVVTDTDLQLLGSVSAGGGGGTAEKEEIDTSGDATKTIADDTTLYVINPSAPVATMTRQLPGKPAEGQKVSINILQDITSFTVTCDNAHVIAGSITNIEAISGNDLQYQFFDDVWYLTRADVGDLSLDWNNISGKPANITLMGNTFNGADQLVQLDASGKLPAVDGSALLNLPITGWALSGNAGTTAGTNFIGTTDARDFYIKANNITGAVFTDTNIGIGGAPAVGVTSTFTSLNLIHTRYPIAMSPDGGSSRHFFGSDMTKILVARVDGTFEDVFARIDSGGKLYLGMTSGSAATGNVQINKNLNITGSFFTAGLSIGDNANTYAASTGNVVLMGTSSINAWINFNRRGTSWDYAFGEQSSTADLVWYYAPSAHNAFGGTERLRLKKSGNFLIGAAVDDPSAILNVKSTEKGVLFCKMSNTQWGLIASKAEGLEAWSTTDHAKLWFDGTDTIGFRYNRTTSKFQGFDGTNWNDLN